MVTITPNIPKPNALVTLKLVTTSAGTQEKVL